MKRILQAATFTLFVHSFAGWFYIAENAAFHPNTLSMPLTHFASYPREDTFGILSFAVSFIALFTYMLIRGTKH